MASTDSRGAGKRSTPTKRSVAGDDDRLARPGSSDDGRLACIERDVAVIQEKLAHIEAKMMTKEDRSDFERRLYELHISIIKWAVGTGVSVVAAVVSLWKLLAKS